MRPRWLDLVALFIVALAIGVRLARLDQFIAADELRWVCRSLSFGEAVTTGNYPGTFQTGHPGVVTMWLGALAAWTVDSSAAAETCRLTEKAQSPSAATAEQLAALADLLWRMRVAPAVFNGLLLIAAYWLARRLLGAPAALAGLILLALDPFYLAHSRVLHLDATLSGLLLLSALALLVGLGVGRDASLNKGGASPPSSPEGGKAGGTGFSPLWLLVSGLLAGMALTQKVSAVFLWPVVALVVLVWWVGMRRRTKRWAWGRLLQTGLVWSIAALLGLLAVWPAVWSDSVGTAQGVVDKAALEGGNPHASGQVLGEEVVDDPGGAMYGLALAFRASPLMLLGLLLTLWGLVRWQRGGLPSAYGWPLLALLGYALLFGALISLSPKKFDRYLLPVFPALDLVAGAGLAGLFVRRVKERTLVRRLPGRRTLDDGRPQFSLRNAYAIGLLILLGAQAWLALPHAPYYLTYYNPLLGGGPAASHWLLIGWGEGYDQAAAYLNTLPNATDVQAAVRGVSQFAPLFVGQTRSAPGYRPFQTEYVVLYSNEVQRRRNEGLIERYFENPDARPAYVVRLHGIDYAWVYPNTTAEKPLADLQAAAQPGDALIVNGASLAARDAPAELPRAEVFGHFAVPETLEALGNLPVASRWWYLRYPEADPGVVLDVLAEQAILEGEPKVYPNVELRAYQPAPAVDQLANADFGGLFLTGWGYGPAPLVPGQPAGLSLTWSTLRPPSRDLTVVVEVVDGQGFVIATAEKGLRDQTLTPTSKWTPGARQTLVPLTIPRGTPPGQYAARLRLKAGSDWLPRRDNAMYDIRLGTVDVTRPPQAPQVDIPNPTQADLGGGLELLGYALSASQAPPGGSFVTETWWRSTGPLTATRLDQAIRDITGRRGPVASRAPVLGQTPEPGDTVRLPAQISAPTEATTGPAWVELSLRDGGGQPLAAAPARIGPVWLTGAPLTQLPRPPGRTLNYAVGETARLVGYDATQTATGEVVDITLYWQAQGPSPTDYSVFVHLLQPDGTILTQVDRAPGLGHYPTSAWRAGEYIVDPYRLSIPSGTPPDKYLVAVGLYNHGGRAPVRDEAGQPVADDRVMLEVEIR